MTACDPTAPQKDEQTSTTAAVAHDDNDGGEGKGCTQRNDQSDDQACEQCSRLSAHKACDNIEGGQAAGATHQPH